VCEDQETVDEYIGTFDHISLLSEREINVVEELDKFVNMRSLFLREMAWMYYLTAIHRGAIPRRAFYLIFAYQYALKIWVDTCHRTTWCCRFGNCNRLPYSYRRLYEIGVRSEIAPHCFYQLEVKFVHDGVGYLYRFKQMKPWPEQPPRSKPIEYLP